MAGQREMVNAKPSKGFKGNCTLKYSPGWHSFEDPTVRFVFVVNNPREVKPTHEFLCSLSTKQQ